MDNDALQAMSWRERLYIIIFFTSTPAGKRFDTWLLVVIFASLVVVMELKTAVRLVTMVILKVVMAVVPVAKLNIILGRVMMVGLRRAETTLVAAQLALEILAMAVVQVDQLVGQLVVVLLDQTAVQAGHQQALLAAPAAGQLVPLPVLTRQLLTMVTAAAELEQTPQGQLVVRQIQVLRAVMIRSVAMLAIQSMTAYLLKPVTQLDNA